jgi:hypothetical protein
MKVPASYLCDALRDFVDAVATLFITDTAECVWEEEPGEVRWEFRRDGHNLTVKVYWDSEGQSFMGNDDLLRFSRKIDRELEGLLATWGEEGYLNKWHYTFPHEAHTKLKQGIQREREHRKAAR